MRKVLILIIAILIITGCGKSVPNEETVKVDFKNLHHGCKLIEIEQVDLEYQITKYNVTFIENQDTVVEFWNYHTSDTLDSDNFILEVRRDGKTPFRKTSTL